MGPLISLFWTSGNVCPGFQSQGGSLTCTLSCLHAMDSSGVTPADLLAAKFRNLQDAESAFLTVSEMC